MSEFGLVARSERMPQQGGTIEGGSPLAGHFGLSSLLVREAVQNSWDARDDQRGDAPVVFEIHGWDIDTDALGHLRSLLPVDDLGGFERIAQSDEVRGVLHPSAAIGRESLRVLLISDRNTVGLCGPTRSGHEWQPIRHGDNLPRGQQRFANFIRNVGRATADTSDGDGGAYGIGKSALWMASECGTVLVHSRTTDHAGEPVERFIGSVHGEHFYSNGIEYTGRHFIGHEADDGVIEPLSGAVAKTAATGLPIPPYAHNGTAVDGTTIIIVAPRLHLPWPTEMDRLRDAVRWHVWPKRVPGVRDKAAGPDMDIRIGWNNHHVDLPEPLIDPEIRPYAKALLDCARERNSDDEGRDLIAECHRPRKVLGNAKFRSAGRHDQNVFHLTLTDDELTQARRKPSGDNLIDDEPVVDFEVPWGQMALIRREPLLLVRYEPIGGPDAAATEVGVFLSADDPEIEEALTRAEPPAHDDWIHRIVPKDHPRDHRRTFAKRIVEEIKRSRLALHATYRTAGVGERGGGEQLVSRRISEGLLGGLGGKRAPQPDNPSGNPASRKPHALLAAGKTYLVEGDTVHEVDLTILGLGEKARAVILTAGGSGQDNTGAIRFDDVDDLVSFSWLTADGTAARGASLSTTAADNTRLTLIVRVLSDLRFRPRVGVGLSDAS